MVWTIGMTHPVVSGGWWLMILGGGPKMTHVTTYTGDGSGTGGPETACSCLGWTWTGYQVGRPVGPDTRSTWIYIQSHGWITALTNMEEVITGLDRDLRCSVYGVRCLVYKLFHRRRVHLLRIRACLFLTQMICLHPQLITTTHTRSR